MKKIIIITALLAIITINSISQHLYKFELVKDINPIESSVPRNFTLSNNQIFFVAIGDSIGIELFVTDGTANGTHLVKNINTQHFSSTYNDNSSNPWFLTPFDNKVIFTANDDIHGYEPWISDGTSNGTYLLGDLCPINMGSNYGSNPDNYIKMGNNIYFFADNYSGSKIYSTDGTPQGTTIIKNFTAPSPTLEYFYKHNNMLYFNGLGEPYRSDGTDSGTYMLKDIRPFWLGSSNPYNFIAFQNKVFFIADDSIHGYEIWTTDGTSIGTSLYKDINSTPTHGSCPSNFIILNDKLFFYARDNSNLIKIWYIKGDVLYFVKTINTQINCFQCNPSSKFYVYDNKIYFSATDNYENNCELWVTDGSFYGTHKILSNDSTSVYNPTNFINWDGKLVFIAGTITERKLWISDGTQQGTHKIVPDSLTLWAKVEEEPMVILNNEIFFNAKFSDQIGYELYKLYIDPYSAISENDKILKNKPEIFPNLFSNEINIDLNNNKTIEITLMDMTGRILKKIKQSDQKKTYNFSDLHSGMYILSFKNENLIWTEKIVKY